MAVPEEVQKQALSVNEDENKIEIRCPKCNDYQSEVLGDDYEEAEDAFNQAKRMYGSHWSAKHKDGGQGGSTSPNNQQATQQQSSPQQGQSAPNQQPQEQQTSQGISERELIYQEGEDGLNKIKKERLKDWLQDLEGVGGQAESRIMRMFNKNDSAKNDPNVLYNIISRETTTSPAYINTMVQDIFEPEREHEDLLRDHGFMPWFKRKGASAQGGFGQFQNQQGGMSQGGMGYQQSAGGGAGGGMGQQQGVGPGNQRGMRGQQHGQQQQQQTTDDSVSREEAAMMVERAVENAKEEDETNALVSGLSEATDEAIREAATNFGGLAGTLHNVVDEALVNYARENPEWVIENMSVLQAFMNKGEELDPPDSGNQSQRDDHVSKVDDAVSAVESGNVSNSPPQQQQHNQPQQHSQQGMTGQPQERRGMTQSPPQDQAQEKYGGSSDFEPAQETQEKIDKESEKMESQGDDGSQPDMVPEMSPSPGGEVGEKSESIKEDFENKQDAKDNNSQERNHEPSDEGTFDELFGDMAEE